MSTQRQFLTLKKRTETLILSNFHFVSRLGEEFEETTTDGRKCKTTVKNHFHSLTRGLFIYSYMSLFFEEMQKITVKKIIGDVPITNT